MHRVAPPRLAPVTSATLPCKPSARALCSLLDGIHRAHSLTVAAPLRGRLRLPHSPDLVPQRRRLGIAIELFEQKRETLGGLEILPIGVQRALVGMDGRLVLALLFIEHTTLHMVVDAFGIVSRDLWRCHGRRKSLYAVLPLVQGVELL